MPNIEPKFEEILAAKRDYYGWTESAIHFAAEEYTRQMLLAFSADLKVEAHYKLNVAFNTTDYVQTLQEMKDKLDLLLNKYESETKSLGVQTHEVSFGTICHCLDCGYQWPQKRLNYIEMKCPNCGNSGGAAKGGGVSAKVDARDL
jgi:rubrerythrin